jgi:parallel beta-helix repeat protein
MNSEKITKRALLMLMTISLIASIFASSGAIGIVQTSGTTSGSTMTSSPVIHIDSNAQLASLISSKGWSGSGTSSNPYVIENLEINAIGSGNAIYIGNTTAYVNIRGCSLFNAELKSSPYQAGWALTLYNVSNALVENNYCNDSIYGIYLHSSISNTILNNTCNGNSQSGINLFYSNNNTISNNSCTDTVHGIYLANSNNNTLWNDRCKGILRCGIMLSASSNNMISNFTSSVTGNNGLHLDSSSNNNTVTNNTFNGNANSGLLISASSNHNTVTHNNCSANNNNGIFLSGSIGNIISDNICLANANYGINLFNSNGNLVSNNTCNNSVHQGIDLFSSNDNRLYGNRLTNNNGASSTYNSSHIQASDSGVNQWNTSSYGNYWSDWTTPDANNDGIVDSPYAITGGSNVDSYPLVVGTTAPTIIVRSPMGNGVSCSATINVTFDQVVNKSSVGVTVNGVAGVLSWSGNTTIFTPSSALAYNTTYSVLVTGRGITGSSVTTTWTFTTMKNEGNISGTIKDADGKAIANATITLSNGMTTLTDANGAFSFADVTAGTYNLTVSKGGYTTTTHGVSAVAGQTADLGSLSMQAAPGSNDALVIGIVVLAVVALLAIVFVVFRRRKRVD